jgi:hypothetical protein
MPLACLEGMPRYHNAFPKEQLKSIPQESAIHDLNHQVKVCSHTLGPTQLQ